MSGFSVEALERKLAELNNSQQMIQTLSLWLIHYRKHCKTAVQTWIKFLRSQRTVGKKLTLLYLANDVIQNSRKKGPEYMNEFAAVLRHAFESIARSVASASACFSCLVSSLTISACQSILSPSHA